MLAALQDAVVSEHALTRPTARMNMPSTVTVCPIRISCSPRPNGAVAQCYRRRNRHEKYAPAFHAPHAQPLGGVA